VQEELRSVNMETRSVVQIKYCCISYGEIILVCHHIEAENYTPMVRSVLRNLDSTKHQKLAYQVDR
jgi:hypothetical protein